MSFRRGVIAAVIVGLLGLGANAGIGIYNYVRLDNAQKANHALAQAALRQSIRIEQQRYDITLNNCKDQNRRNARVDAYLKSDFARAPLPASPAAAAAQARSQAQVRTLLDAAVPHRDCSAVANAALAAVGPPIPKSTLPRAKSAG